MRTWNLPVANRLSPGWSEARWFRNSILLPIWFLNGWLLLRLVSYLQPFLTMFILALVVALLIDGPVRTLQRWGLGRGVSLLVVLLVMMVLGSAALAGLLPSLVKQAGALVRELPDWVDSARGLAGRVLALPWMAGGPMGSEDLLNLLGEQLAAAAQALVSGLPGLLGTGLSIGLLLFLTVILTVFLLVGGPAAWHGVLRWLPPWWRRRIDEELPLRLRLFLRGQIILAVGFSVILAIVFSLLGIPFGLLFGFLIGMASLIPFMGAVSQVSVSLFLMLHDLTTGLTVFAIAFVLGQILDNVVVPRVMGSLVGLNPLWLLFTLFLGGKVAGLPGVLVAIPVASTVRVLADDWRTRHPGLPEGETTAGP